MILVDDLLRGNTFLPGLDGDRDTMFIRPADINDILSLQPHVPCKDISRYVNTGQVAYVYGPVGVGKRRRNKVPFEPFHDAHKDIQESIRSGRPPHQLFNRGELQDFEYFSTMQLRPPNLEKGNLVGITAPARWVEPSDIEDFTALLEEEGYRLMTGSIHERHYQLAGNDRERLRELQAMMDHPGVRAIFCARGGYGSIRLLEEIDLSGFARSPKWLVGFSDITALHALLQKRLRCETLHACMPYSVKGNARMDNPSVVSMFEALQGKAHAYPVKAVSLNKPGQAEGILMGGNLSVLYSLTGTAFQPDTDGAILFLEDVDEYLYHIDRMMQNLKLSGMLEGIRGLVIGGMVDMRDNDIPFGQDACQIIHEAVREYNYPLLFGFPAGHMEPNLALVLGRQYLMDVNESGGGILSTSL